MPAKGFQKKGCFPYVFPAPILGTISAIVVLVLGKNCPHCAYNFLQFRGHISQVRSREDQGGETVLSCPNTAPGARLLVLQEGDCGLLLQPMGWWKTRPRVSGPRGFEKQEPQEGRSHEIVFTQVVGAFGSRPCLETTQAKEEGNALLPVSIRGYRTAALTSLDSFQRLEDVCSKKEETLS